MHPQLAHIEVAALPGHGQDGKKRIPLPSAELQLQRFIAGSMVDAVTCRMTVPFAPPEFPPAEILKRTKPDTPLIPLALERYAPVDDLRIVDSKKVNQPNEADVLKVLALLQDFGRRVLVIAKAQAGEGEKNAWIETDSSGVLRDYTAVPADWGKET